ncbi:PhaM family polyhydroxyalkanoate granule multifunctional regulatory protein [Chitinasiproducens palmae]|uniref:Uncharacterized protein n=1 Tax=Chitinasiproducens palmae TaxID=1770053 RepID=A0A1H2PQT3_9BURK|nr:PhaM family polyhydroxyalkanoate granule multifunctional regulatory protein [Chitinasiproducens palmae]SDV48372.1 hypothetical protein SAMN05216551_10536 [Chitinasiproducens palmae]
MSANDTSGIPGWDFFTRAAETMRQTPFGAAMGTGMGTGMGMPGAGAPWSMMTDMLAPLTNIDDLDRRINEVRAVEQWLKLNLGMVQSTAQALEVQRATLATLKAFGSMAGSGAGFAQAGFPFGAAATGAAGEAKAPPSGQASSAGQAGAGTTNPFTGAASAHGMPDMSAATEGAATWWRMLNDQFSQIASMASAGLTPAGGGGGSGAGPDAAAAPAGGSGGAGAGGPATEGVPPEAAERDDPAAAARRRRKP